MSGLLSRQNDGVLIAQFTHHKLYDDALIREIASDLLELADKSEGKMVLDFDGVKFMSSSMIGRVVILNKKCKQDNIKLRMCNVAPTVMEVFEVTRLNRVFAFSDSVEDALNELG